MPFTIDDDSDEEEEGFQFEQYGLNEAFQNLIETPLILQRGEANE